MTIWCVGGEISRVILGNWTYYNHLVSRKCELMSFAKSNENEAFIYHGIQLKKLLPRNRFALQ